MKNQRFAMVDVFRPISILPVVSKLMEQIIYNKTYEYFNKEDPFSKHHLGFRPNDSTSAT